MRPEAGITSPNLLPQPKPNLKPITTHQRPADAPVCGWARQNRKAKFEEDAQARAGNQGMSRYGQQEVCPYSGVIVNKVRRAAACANMPACEHACSRIEVSSHKRCICCMQSKPMTWHCISGKQQSWFACRQWLLRRL